MGFRSLGRIFRVRYRVLYATTPGGRLFFQPLAVAVTGLAWVNARDDRFRGQAQDWIQPARLESGRPNFRVGCRFPAGILTPAELVQCPQLAPEDDAHVLVGKAIADARPVALRATHRFAFARRAVGICTKLKERLSV